MHQSSYDKMIRFRDRYLADRKSAPLVIYDLGSQDINGSYRPIFSGSCWRYAGIDMAPGKNVDIVLRNPYAFREIRGNSADVVVSGQAFEHIRYFWLTILEIARVLKPGGLCCVLAPSGGPEHRYPDDCWRFYPDGMRAMADFARLETLETSTQWQDEGYDDGSDQWHDSLLVCRKPDDGFWPNFNSRLKAALRHRMMRLAMG
ncbi:MAG: methyltransferase domain-containing protein [Thermodesulfobacteriota bacterium]